MRYGDPIWIQTGAGERPGHVVFDNGATVNFQYEGGTHDNVFPAAAIRPRDTGRDECRYCGASIVPSADGAWNDDSGACGCGVGEHEPGGFSQAAHDKRAAETPWW